MAEPLKREKVYQVFQHISSSYDAANERISLGMEGRWKQQLIDQMTDWAEPNGQLLDVCCGTGDIAIALAASRPDLSVTGLDFSPAMLQTARQKSRRLDNVSWYEGDAMTLPFSDNTFAAACISFGLRNTSDYRQVLCEMARVVRPGGWVCCLDSFVPDSPWIRPFYALYFRGIMPFLGGGLRHRRDYLWLWQSTRDFLRKQQLLDLFQTVGLTHVQMESHLFGTCVLHKGQKRISTRNKRKMKTN